MSYQIYIKKLDFASWLPEIEWLQSITDEEARETAFFEMLYSTGERPESVLFRSEALGAILAYEKICESFEGEIRGQTELFLDAFPLRLWAEDAPLSIGQTFPILEEYLDGWLLTQGDIQRLVRARDLIDAYCEDEVVKIQAEASKIAASSWRQRLLNRRLADVLEKREYYLRDVWGYVESWKKTLQNANQSEVALLVFMM